MTEPTDYNYKLLACSVIQLYYRYLKNSDVLKRTEAKDFFKYGGIDRIANLFDLDSRLVRKLKAKVGRKCA